MQQTIGKDRVRTDLSGDLEIIGERSPPERQALNGCCCVILSLLECGVQLLEDYYAPFPVDLLAAYRAGGMR
eukprot:3697299-Pyramimonas_sp.AAC.4